MDAKMPAYGLAEFLAEVERNFEARTTEILCLQRAMDSAADEPTRAVFRRAFITLLYAHAEGGAAFAILCYLNCINTSTLTVEDCHPLLVASAWNALFRDLADTGNKKGKLLRGEHRENPKLQRLVRRKEFVERHRELVEMPVRIPEEVVDTESNLDQAVLARLLFQVGFEGQLDSREFGELEFLKNLRNKVAHGELEQVSEEQCRKYRTAVESLLTRLRDLFSRAIMEESYRRKAA